MIQSSSSGPGESLPSSEELLRTALGAARMYAWEWDVAREVAHVSEGAAEIVGLTGAVDVTTAWSHVHPEDAPGLRAAVERALAGDGRYSHTVRFRRFDSDAWIWLEYHGRVLRGPDGRITRIIGVAVDVTGPRRAQAALVESERRALARAEELSTLMESVPAIVWVATDPGGHSIIGNRASDELLRLASGQNASLSALDGAPDHYRILSGDRELAPEELPIQRALREGRPIRDFHEDVVFDDGTRVSLFGNVVPLHNPDGTVRGAVAAFLDVTRLKQVEAEIRELNQTLERRVGERTGRLQEAIRELETFSYTIAHDLRAPLRAISNFAHLLREEHIDPDDATGRSYARLLEDAARRMDALVQDLLEYSRLARQDVPLEPAALRPLLEEVVRRMTPELDARRARVEIAGDFPHVLAHPPSLRQAVTNLIDNASKFVPAGRDPVVRLRAATDGPRARLWVEDNGLGIAPEYLGQIFGVFQRLHRQEEYPGTGIGLAIVKRVAERHGGSAGVESEPGRGSRFYLELAVATPPAAPDPS